MIREKNEIIAYLVLLAVLFVVGVGLGYYIWGMERGEQPDYRTCLSKAAEHLAAIETSNRELHNKTEVLQKEIAALTVRIKEGPDKLNEQIRKLESQVASLTREKEKTVNVTTENRELKEQVKGLAQELEALGKENVALQSALVSCDDLLKEKEQLESELMEVMLERDSLREELEGLRSDVGEHDAILEANKNYATQVRTLEDQVKSLNTRLEAIQQLVAPETGNGGSGLPAGAM